ncbi:MULTISPECIES: hypothetical protein [Acinetobacter]|uniref:hypothetical protein n=1 Tax=Acinetobacter TaxID=469 RepID=UPI0005370906|nr:hypothetical protein [Acinetobacter sp. HR7]KGT48843.1 hypothetical protein GW12_01230 [Acinetobacter sp. HR7]
MSYKHNNLMAMRTNYWNDEQSPHVQQEKAFLQDLLVQSGVFPQATPDDARYLFFCLPSIIIVRGYAVGFQHESVLGLIQKFIQTNIQQLQQRTELKIHYQMP